MTWTAVDNLRELFGASEQRTDQLQHQPLALEVPARTDERQLHWWRSIVCGVALLSLLGLAIPPGKAEEVSLTSSVGGRYLPTAEPSGFDQAGNVSVGQAQAGWFAFDLGPLAGATVRSMTFSFIQVETTNSQFFPLTINIYDVTTPFDRLIVDRIPLDAEGEQITEDLHTGDVYASFVVTADGEGTGYVIALNNDAINDLQLAINRGDQFFSIGLANASFNAAGWFTLGDATLEVSVIGFAGSPGTANCHGESVSALTQQFGSLRAAALARGVPSVRALQDAIREFCKE